jgi:light-harvesting protein B-800-850 alpha chain
MNQGKIWLVVKPTVGLPAFLGGVAVIALCVHAAILTNTTWYPNYYSGKAKAEKAATAPAKTSETSTVSAADPVAGTEAPVLLAKAVPGKP